MVIFSEITEKECVKERYTTRKREFDLCNIAQPSQQQLSSCSWMNWFYITSTRLFSNLRQDHPLMRAFSYACSLPVTWQRWQSHDSIHHSGKPHAARTQTSWLYGQKCTAPINNIPMHVLVLVIMICADDFRRTVNKRDRMMVLRSPSCPQLGPFRCGRAGCGLHAGEWRSNLYEMTRAMMNGAVRSYSSITQRPTRCARHSQTRHLYAYTYATATAAAAAACNDDDASRVAVASITWLRWVFQHDLCIHVQRAVTIVPVAGLRERCSGPWSIPSKRLCVVETWSILCVCACVYVCVCQIRLTGCLRK